MHTAQGGCNDNFCREETNWAAYHLLCNENFMPHTSENIRYPCISLNPQNPCGIHQRQPWPHQPWVNDPQYQPHGIRSTPHRAPSPSPCTSPSVGCPCSRGSRWGCGSSGRSPAPRPPAVAPSRWHEVDGRQPQGSRNRQTDRRTEELVCTPARQRLPLGRLIQGI